ncbi:MAG TPA: FKBP-type peptidyl-prolyl cis-trans isomerase [Streptosporangiaceae bacterium]|nr:FKBP-type peptidyl-prolyl cis-trans isomerase [Streptosporangiaceae bacterium]
MRRIAAAVLVPLAACAALAGCGSSGGPAADPNAAVKVTGAFDKAPKVSIPAEKAGSKLVYSTPIKGTGAVLASGDSALANVALYKWSGTKHSLVDSTYSSGPQIIPAQMGLVGLTDALKGARMGSRIVAVLPPKYGYGSSGQSSLQITGTDTVVWVIDLLQQYTATQSASGTQVSTGGGKLPSVTAKTGTAPAVSVPKNTTPPKKLSVTTLIKGTGSTLAKGDTVVTQYVGVNWRTGKVFGSSWPSSQDSAGQLLSFQVDGTQVLPGLSDALAGIPVGSRVMVVIPPALGYGPEGGQSSAGIKKNDTLVFVVDVLGSQPA